LIAGYDFFKYEPLERKKLIDTAMGREPADIVIVNANVVSVTTGEVLEKRAILVKGRRIAGVSEYGDLRKFVGSNTLVINAEGDYVIPGFIDPHIHIESSMLTPTSFAKIALKHGTTTVVADPHEIGNVAGLEGVKAFIEEARNLPLKILVDMPSCVPATDPSRGLETVASVIGVDGIRELASIPGVIGLGEVMDYVSVVNAESDVLEKIRIAHEHGLRVSGHAPLLTGRVLDAYIAAGIYSDHETVSFEEALEKLRRGMYVFIREGSAWRDLEALSKLLLDDTIDCQLCCFTSDDLSVLDLFEKGHMDRVVNKAIELGVDPVKAIQLATINTARYLKLEEHIGVIAPGRLADLVFTRELKYIAPHTVIANGEVVYFKGELKKEFSKPRYSEKLLKTVNTGRLVKSEDFEVRAELGKSSVAVNVIEVKPGSTLTRHIVEKLFVEKGFVKPDPERDLMQVAVIDRHKGTGSMSLGFVKGLGLKVGAVAQTIAHDTHNLIVAGYNHVDMAEAVKYIVESQGGIVVVDNGSVIASLNLQYGGLMSIEEPEVVYRKYKELVEKLKKNYGVKFEEVFMTLSLISLPVIPEIRITDKGLVDVNEGRFIPLIAE